LLFVLIALVALQVPFIYRRYQLGKVAEKIAATNASRIVRTDDKYDEYVGIIHAHTFLGGHSNAKFDELIKGANDAEVDFVMMTEHWSDDYDTAALTLNGKYGRTLFIGGNEIDTSDGDRFLMIPGSAEAASLRTRSTDAVLSKLNAEQRLGLITYPEKYNSWNAAFDGIEVFSLHTSAKAINKFTGPLDILWSGRAYPQLTFAQYFRRPDANLARFDEASQTREISLFAGTDAHSNIGFHLFGDDAGHKFLDFKLDPYGFSFSMARVHTLLPKGTPLTRESAVEAIKRGRNYVGIDALGDSSGFSFTVTSCEDTNETMGVRSEICNDFGPSQAKFKIFSPLNARIVVLRNGEKFAEYPNSTSIDFETKQGGAYRVEVYRDDLGEPFSGMPWIMSNPIYLR